MSGRTMYGVLAAGFVLVLALGLLLFHLTGSAESPTPIAHVPAPGAAPAGEPPPAAQPAAPLARATPRRTPLAPRPAAPTVPAVQPELPALVQAFRPDTPRDANGKLVPVITVKTLRAQLSRTDAPMRACLDRAGMQVTGKATLSFTVVARDGKLVIETTGIEDPGTLADQPDLLECMHRTATAFVLDGAPVPELGTPVYVRRHVQIHHGALAENTIFNFSYNP